MTYQDDKLTRARKQLDQKLAPLRDQAAFVRPAKGWVRAIRDALGMTGRQLAERLGIKQPTLVALEQGEVNGTITMGRLKELAEALDCTLVYALVPNRPLQQIVADRARHLANLRLMRTHHSMRLEDQGLAEADLADERDRLAAGLLRDNARQIWRPDEDEK
ncbi:mobile mystery protein A [uncultured Maricaulis sp.]|uniref:mobile mystery protein A n=1 Tax=uncultured Maricaulis sp. TaxID=174710 RepID=UPI0030DABAC4|tara:strand:- start:23951 stop:24436 length:486 start_codon:yes stop_codon:yes gene_type:complete